MSDKEKNKNLENRTSNPQNNAGSFPNKNSNNNKDKENISNRIDKSKKDNILNNLKNVNYGELGKNVLKGAGKNLVNAGVNALMNEDNPDIGDETANEAIGAASNTVNTAKKAKNTYQTGKKLYNKYKQKRKAKEIAKKSGEAAKKAGQTAKKAGEAIKKTTTVISKGVAKIASAIGASPAGVVILIGVGIFLLLFIFYAILEGSDIGYSSLDMKYGVTSDDAYSIFGNDDEYKLGMSTSEIDDIYDTKNHTLKCETGFFASLANVFGIYNLKNPCEFSTYIRNLTQNAERKYNITTISPGDLLSTLYYAYASQIVDDDGNNTIPTDSGKLDETDDSSISEFDAISILFSNGIYDKGDISDLLDNYILIKDKYPYYRYEKETTEETDDAGSDEEDTEEKYVCKEHTMANVISEDKFKLYLRYGSEVSEEYEKVISYKEALNYTSSECTDDFYKKNGNLTDTDITKFKNVYVPNSDLIESESNLEEDTDREEKFAKAFINVNGINYTYEDGFIYKTYPRYDKKYTKEEPEYNSFTLDEIEGIIYNIVSRKEYINYFLGYPSSVTSMSYFNTTAICTYNVNGKDYTNLKVRLVHSKNKALDGIVTEGEPIEGQELIDFEKYILGVVYAEIGDGGEESLKVQSIVARNLVLNEGKIVTEGDQNILEISNSTWDQTYCDPENGCDICMHPDTNTVHSVYTRGTTPNSTYCKNWKGALDKNSKLRSAVRSVNGVTLKDSSNNLYSGIYTIEMQNTWKSYESEGLDYVEIIQKYWDGIYSVVNAECSIGELGEWSTWKQYDDARWGTILMSNIPRPNGDPRTIHKIGCLMTSYAMVIAKSAPTIIIQNFNPGTYTEALKANNALGKYGDMPDGSTAIRIATGLTNVDVQGEELMPNDSFDYKLSEISKYLANGYDVIIRVKSEASAAIQGGGNSHYVVVTGISDGEIYIADPGYDTQQFSKRYINQGLTYIIAIKF